MTSVSSCFCWTRFGTEASEPIERILARKERERIANNGIFYWGIGNAIGPSVRELLLRSCPPKVLFSPIKSSAQLRDVSPSALVAWTMGTTLEGKDHRLPASCLVTSRYDLECPKAAHYALVCYSAQSLEKRGEGEVVNRNALRNLLTGRRIGASQVTAVVEECEPHCSDEVFYQVAMSATLTYPYFLRLSDAVLFPTHRPTDVENLHDFSRVYSSTGSLKRSSTQISLSY